MQIKYFLKTIIWVLVIFILSSVSGDTADDISFIDIPHFDKMAHFAMYFVLSLLMMNAFSKMNRRVKDKAIYTILAGAFYGGLMEVMQEYVFVKRSMDIYDFAVNLIGTIMAVVLYRFISRLRINGFL
ncbi:MAG: hypothetical protein A2W91_16360 [Bacteroidetes bacterium GWF2_38_335]|nr:MAG: hypothetical protein A2W91_16360 [Bacteroidetes bacterium GWF2_38_335]OFY81262.1 MAG: hypothetical protein A2281_07335 [Bacteroidetes bacterium RIFOXYA12_FULL_38_20]HBS85380.1 hypothetical protein [Bacteroidales bacterium]